ncbi:MAG: VWA domain-containing protein [Alphaproteobacteria bacterium]|nr:VWA domain-containing protein [Alphaproteobacteria bacterium]
MSKFDYAATLAASLAYLLQRQQDASGLVTFDRAVRVNLPASAHPGHVKQIVHELARTACDDRTDLSQAFERLSEQVRRRGLVVLISDLLADVPMLNESLGLFRHRGHEVVVFHVLHAHEVTFPFADNTMFRGLEIDRQLLAEPRALRQAYLEAKDRFVDEIKRTCAALDIDYVGLSTDDPLDAALSAYLAARWKARRTARRA